MLITGGLMVDVFEILKGSDGKLDAKQVLHEEIGSILAQLYFYKEMLGDRENEKNLIEQIRNNLVRLRFALDEFLTVK